MLNKFLPVLRCASVLMVWPSKKVSVNHPGKGHHYPGRKISSSCTTIPIAIWKAQPQLPKSGIAPRRHSRMNRI